MNHKQILIEAGKKMVNDELTIETWGNISIRDKETQLVYMTPSAMDYNSIKEDDIVVCQLDGTIVEGKRKPTIETNMHLGIYNNRPDVNAVIHTHPIYSLVFGVLREDIPPIIDEAAQILGDCVPITEYALPGSDHLAQVCVDLLGKNRKAIVMASHGALCVGEDIDMAFKVSAVLEMTAKVYTLARSIGTPKTLSSEDIQTMHHYAYNNYGQGK